MRQKLKFAQALVHDPPLLILDEPTAGLDPEERNAMLSRIRTLAQREGKSVVLCTRILQEVQAVSDAVVILGEGRVPVADRLDALAQRESPAVHVRTVGSAAALQASLEQRGLTVAIAHNPELLILDEPFSGLDPIGRHEVAEFLRQWICDGRSLILASHVLHEIESITRSFLLLSRGRLLASGSVDTIHELLADVPREVTIGANDARQLASDLLLAEMADAVRLAGPARLTVSSRSVLKLYDFLCEWATASQGEIIEIRSDDESLQEVFSSLLRIHRGEM